MAEHDVATDVVGEAFVIRERSRQAADVVVGLEDDPILVTELLQPVSTAKPVGPAPMMTILGLLLRPRLMPTDRCERSVRRR